MLKQWIKMVVTGGSSSKLVPDLFSFNIVLNAIAKSGREDAGRQAQTLYEEMLEIGVAPDIITFNSLMNAFAQSAVARSALNSRHGEKDLIIESRDTKNESDDVGRQAQALFDDMIARGVTPDSTTYNSLLNVFAKHGHARKAQQLLDRMERDEWNGHWRIAFVTNQRLIAYNTVLSAWVKSGRMHNNDDVGLLEAAVSTQAMLQRMRKHEVRPNGLSYAAVLNSLENCGGPECAEVAERILNDMEKDGVIPKKVHYSTVIDTWINSGDPERAFELVKKMESMMTRMDATGLLVHPAVYVSVISAFARRREPERAEAILSHMEDCETAPPPTMAAYAATLTMWANSDDPEKARRAWQVLERMRSRVDEKRRNRVIPILRGAHNTVISACATLPLPATKSLVHEATEIAIRVFNGTPQRDDDTDKSMMQAMRHLVSDPDELDSLMRRIK
jgi:pentatricopeptide repeat protein